MIDRTMPAPRQSFGGIQWAMVALAVGGLALSLYLLSQSLLSQPLAGCGAESGCGQVLATRWSQWLGLPVSFLSAGVYLLALSAMVYLGPRQRAFAQRFAWTTLLITAALAALAAVWFVVLQAAVLKTVCYYCMALHAVGVSFAGVVFVGAARTRSALWPTVDGSTPTARPLPFQLAFAVAALGMVLLVLGQLAYKPAGYRMEVMEQAEGAAAAPAPGEPEGSQTGRSVTLLDGGLKLNLVDYPLLGSPQAPYVVAIFFDYTCEFCRELHQHLDEVRQRYGAQLAVVSIVVPYEARCNPYVAITEPRHRGACEYARLSLAVWRANPAAFARFDRWLLTGTLPPSLERAQAFAADLVGAEELKRALGDPGNDRQIQQHIALQRQTGTGLVPQLAAPGGRIIGRVGSPQVLIDLFEKQMGLRPVGESTP